LWHPTIDPRRTSGRTWPSASLLESLKLQTRSAHELAKAAVGRSLAGDAGPPRCCQADEPGRIHERWEHVRLLTIGRTAFHFPHWLTRGMSANSAVAGSRPASIFYVRPATTWWQVTARGSRRHGSASLLPTAIVRSPTSCYSFVRAIEAMDRLFP
jgi:hypothetical protein